MLIRSSLVSFSNLIRILSLTAIECVFPPLLPSGTTKTCNASQLALKTLHISAVHACLRQAIVNLNHCKNRSPIQLALEMDLHEMIIQLLVMIAGASMTKDILIPWHKLRESRMRCAQHSLVDHAKDSDIPSQDGRSKDVWELVAFSLKFLGFLLF